MLDLPFFFCCIIFTCPKKYDCFLQRSFGKEQLSDTQIRAAKNSSLFEVLLSGKNIRFFPLNEKGFFCEFFSVRRQNFSKNPFAKGIFETSCRQAKKSLTVLPLPKEKNFIKSSVCLPKKFSKKLFLFIKFIEWEKSYLFPTRELPSLAALRRFLACGNLHSFERALPAFYTDK